MADSPFASFTIPAALFALGIGSLAGGVLGYAGHAYFVQPEVIVPPPEVIKEEISDEALLALCSELTADEKARVVEAQERVSTLQQQLSQKEAELATLKQQVEAEAAQDESRAKAARKKWRDMEQEVASLRIQLAEAEAERDQLRDDLKKTLRDLDRQIAETAKFKAKAIHYQQESTKNLWSAFGSNAKVEICDKGTRNRHEKCHAAVESALSARVQEKFTTCVDTYQAVPVLRQAEKGEALPQFAERLPDDNKFTRKNWYIIYCDPTLPEARDPDLVETAPATPDPTRPMDLNTDDEDEDLFELPEAQPTGGGQ